MTGGLAENALARIDAALARIEHSMDRIEAERDASSRRHARLRAAVSETLEQLDGLIAGQNR